MHKRAWVCLCGKVRLLVSRSNKLDNTCKVLTEYDAVIEACPPWPRYLHNKVPVLVSNHRRWNAGFFDASSPELKSRATAAGACYEPGD